MRRLPVVVGFFFLALSLFVGSAATQDAKKGDGGKVKGYLPPGFKDLNVTAEQKNRIYTIQTDYRNKINDLEKKIKELKSQEGKDVFAVLTKAQQDQYLKSKGIESPSTKTKKDSDKDKK